MPGDNPDGFTEAVTAFLDDAARAASPKPSPRPTPPRFPSPTTSMSCAAAGAPAIGAFRRGIDSRSGGGPHRRRRCGRLPPLPIAQGPKGRRGLMPQLSVEGASLGYDEAGQGAPAFVFVHGWAGDRSFWRPQVDDLSRDFHCLTLDLRGCGESSMDPPYDLTQAAMTWPPSSRSAAWRQPSSPDTTSAASSPCSRTAATGTA